MYFMYVQLRTYIAVHGTLIHCENVLVVNLCLESNRYHGISQPFILAQLAVLVAPGAGWTATNSFRI